MMRGRKPAWWLLYALLPLAAGLLVAAHLASATVAWREFTEGSVSLVVIGAMALWVRSNRVALALGSGQLEAAQSDETTEEVLAPIPGIDAYSLQEESHSHEHASVATRLSRMIRGDANEGGVHVQPSAVSDHYPGVLDDRRGNRGPASARSGIEAPGVARY